MRAMFDGTYAGWRAAARAALADGVSPDQAQWCASDEVQDELTLMPDAPAAPVAPAPIQRVPRAFVELAADVALHQEPTRWTRLYRALWRLTHGEPHLLEMQLDPDVHALRTMAKDVHHDVHRMRAFVRFREVATDDGPRFVAWYEPKHAIVEANARFFRDRFASMRWSILTPQRCVHWDLSALTFSAGVTPAEAPTEDSAEALWQTYYASTFNPARVNLGALRQHLPAHFRRNLPEANIIDDLVHAARDRAQFMVAESAADADALTRFSPVPLPEHRDIPSLRAAATHCRACPLWRKATCTVFGEGPANAEIVLVGEQPGDNEDRAGKAFIGPAGELLNRALAAAGIERNTVYVTNAVKHFKWEPKGKRRLHKTASAREVAACRPWLEAELRAIRPKLIICLGATASSSVMGRVVKVQTERGQRLETEFGAPALITVHPAALLRLPTGEDPGAEFDRFVSDLNQRHER